MKRILFIDDSLIQQRILTVLLQGKYETLTARSGAEGIALAKKEKPDLILLDYDMPLMTGKETLRKLRQQEETKDIPVVFLTGVDSRSNVEAVLMLRPQGYLLKPVDQNRLFSTVEGILGE